MIRATLSASDIDDLRTLVPLELESALSIAVGTLVDLEFESSFMRMTRPSDDHELLSLWGKVAEESTPAIARFDLAHLLERIDFVQNLHPRPREATLRLEQQEGDPHWWLSPVVDGEQAAAIAVYTSNVSDGDETVADWLELGSTEGWVSERANRAVFDFATDLIDVLANLPPAEQVTLVFAESSPMYSPTRVLFRSENGHEIEVPVRFSGVPTQMTFEVGYLLDKYLSMCQGFEAGVAQLGLFWSRDSERDWFASARWSARREFEWVQAVHGSVGDPTVQASSAPAFCPSCGTGLGENAKFCAHCGAAR